MSIRALILATRGRISNNTVTRATRGILQPSTSLAVHDSVHVCKSSEVVFSARPYVPILPVGGGRIGTETYRPFSEEELRDQFPKELIYAGSLKLKLISESKWSHTQYPLAYKYSIGVAYATLYSATTAYQNLDAHPPTVGPTLRIVSEIDAEVRRPTIRFEDLTPALQLRGTGAFTYVTPTHAQHTGVIETKLENDSSYAFEAAPVLIPELLEPPNEYRHAATLSAELVGEATHAYSTAPLASATISGRVALVARVEASYRHHAQPTAAFSYSGTATVAIEGHAAYQWQAVNAARYTYSAMGGVIVSGTAAVTFTPYIPPYDEEEDLLLIAAGYLLRRA